MALHPLTENMPPFDPTAKCVKCGFSIPEPQPPMGPKKPEPAAPAAPAKKAAPKAKAAEDPAAKDLVPTGPTPPPTPPTTMYCNGEECHWMDGSQDPGPLDQHMHLWCDVCGYEWLTQTLDFTP